MAGAAPLWVRGRRRAEGAGGRDECNIGRGKNNTAPRPVPPAHPGLWNPAPYLLGRWSPDTGVLWRVWVTLEVRQSLDTHKSERGGERERVRREGELLVPRKTTFQRQSSARACSLNTQTERRGAIAMVTGVPATELNGCCLAILGVGVWCRPPKYLWAS